MKAVVFWGAALGLISACAGCRRGDSAALQGYIEGEFVYVAAPLAGELRSLAAVRGQAVSAGDELFSLEPDPEQAARDEAARRLAQAQATLEDLKKGRRPSEIDSLQAQLEKARVALAFAEREFARQERLAQTPGAVAEQERDQARSNRDQAGQHVAWLEADLLTARLPARSDQVAAAEAEVHAREAALTQAEWKLSQKSQAAGEAGLVTDTLYREGEWVPAGRPVVVLLPPRNIKLRAFVPEGRIGAVRAGDRVRVSVDGVFETFVGRVSFIAPQAEYTPPVIFSRESRSKLVFMVEAVFSPEDAAKLHPGQPVDVFFGD